MRKTQHKNTRSAQKTIEINSIDLGRLGPETKLLVLLIIGVCTVVLAVHWPVLSAKALLFDDDLFVSEDSPLVQNPGWALAKRALTEVLKPSLIVGYYQPLPVISIMADCAMGGSSSNLSPFRRTSLAIHIFNTALVIILLYYLFGQPIPAALAGLIFGVHPLTVEPVAWISDRKTLLAMFFTLGSLIFYVCSRVTGHKSRVTGFYVGSLIAYLLALMSKPTSLPVPVLMLVLDCWPLRRFNRKSVIEKIPFFALGILFAVITAVSNTRSIQTPLLSRLEGPAQLLRTFLTVCYLTIFYLRKIFWPINLSSVYVLPEPMLLSNRVISASVFGVFALIAILFFSLRWTRAFLAGLLVFFLAILPVLGIVPFSDWIVASDKYVYMPIIGLLAVLAWAITSLWKKIAVPRTVLIVLLLFLSSVQIYCLRRYLSHWRDTVSLFEYMLKLTPDNAQVHNNLGLGLAKQGRLDEAINHFQQALLFRPGYAKAHTNLGDAFLFQNRLEEAAEQYREALELVGDDVEAYWKLADVFWLQGKFDEAINLYRQVLPFRGDSAELHYKLGYALSQSGEAAEATLHYRRALELEPDYAEAHIGLGTILSEQGKVDEGVGHIRRVLELEPNSAEALNNLGIAVGMQGRFEEAIGYYRRAAALRPDWSLPLNGLAWILATSPDPNMRDAKQAIELAERAAAMTKHQDAIILNTLAAAYAAAGRFSEATATAQKALDIAKASRNDQLADFIRRQLEMYKQGKFIKQ